MRFGSNQECEGREVSGLGVHGWNPGDNPCAASGGPCGGDGRARSVEALPPRVGSCKQPSGRTYEWPRRRMNVTTALLKWRRLQPHEENPCASMRMVCHLSQTRHRLSRSPSGLRAPRVMPRGCIARGAERSIRHPRAFQFPDFAVRRRPK